MQESSDSADSQSCSHQSWQQHTVMDQFSKLSEALSKIQQHAYQGQQE
jgi:hypothetical protein